MLGEEAIGGISCRLDQNYGAERWHQLLQEPEVLLDEFLSEYGHTGDVGAGTSEALHQPGSHGVASRGHDDRYGSGRVLRGTDGGGALRHDDVHVSLKQLGHER